MAAESAGSPPAPSLPGPAAPAGPDRGPGPAPGPGSGPGRGRGNLLHRSFTVGIILKGLDGLAELAGGILLLLVTPAAVNRFVTTVTQHELSEDPHDFVASHLSDWSTGLTGSTAILVALYLLSHGAVKVVLVAALLRNKLWAYPWMIGVLVIFIGYQIYRLILAWSTGLVLLTIFDGVVAWLTYREYRVQRGGRQQPANRRCPGGRSAADRRTA